MFLFIPAFVSRVYIDKKHVWLWPARFFPYTCVFTKSHLPNWPTERSPCHAHRLWFLDDTVQWWRGTWGLHPTGMTLMPFQVMHVQDASNMKQYGRARGFSIKIKVRGFNSRSNKPESTSFSLFLPGQSLVNACLYPIYTLFYHLLKWLATSSGHLSCKELTCSAFHPAPLYPC
jgi:hypothetical protein